MDGSRRKTIEFSLPEPPVNHVTIDKLAMNHIKERAHRIWMETKKPDANLIMFEALKQYMEHKGADANFTVVMDGDSK